MTTTIPGPFAHRDGHDTEQAARDSIAGAAKTIRGQVLRLIVAAGPDGLTDDEGGQLFRSKYPHADRLTFGRRRHELTVAGLVKKSGQRRKTPRGRNAIVWVVNLDGEAVA